jgi:hypothetical protein
MAEAEKEKTIMKATNAVRAVANIVFIYLPPLDIGTY